MVCSSKQQQVAVSSRRSKRRSSTSRSISSSINLVSNDTDTNIEIGVGMKQGGPGYVVGSSLLHDGDAWP